MSRSVRTAPALALLLLALGWSRPGLAYESLFDRLGARANLGRLFPEELASASVQDGFLLGTGSERIARLPDGTLRIERTRHYTQVRHPDTRKLAKLPRAWDVTATVTVTPELRLAFADTRLLFHRDGDHVFPDRALSDEHDWLFKSDRSTLRSSADGKRLSRVSYLGKQQLDSDTYDYPSDAIPLEIVGLYLAVAVERHIDQFEFQLLVPGGSTHGVRAVTHRTRDMRRLAKGYGVPNQKLVSREPLAVVDLRLASPLKYVFFPHHFYMAFSAQDPSKLIMLWGGDPDENLQAFRID